MILLRVPSMQAQLHSPNSPTLFRKNTVCPLITPFINACSEKMNQYDTYLVYTALLFGLTNGRYRVEMVLESRLFV